MWDRFWALAVYSFIGGPVLGPPGGTTFLAPAVFFLDRPREPLQKTLAGAVVPARDDGRVASGAEGPGAGHLRRGEGGVFLGRTKYASLLRSSTYGRMLNSVQRSAQLQFMEAEGSKNNIMCCPRGKKPRNT